MLKLQKKRVRVFGTNGNMPKEIERAFEKEYGKKKGDLIFYKWMSKHSMLKKDYCPHCHKRTEHVKTHGIKMCKTCGYQEKI